MARPKDGITFEDRVKEFTILVDYSCHVFVGHTDECGYGRIGNKGKLVRIHRYRWEQHNGPIPNGMCVCHTCDTPACHNIDHLFLGTHKENMEDCARKGRRDNRGSRGPSSKLDEMKVLDIWKRIKSGETCYSIARNYKVTGETILAIKNGHTWNHVKAA